MAVLIKANGVFKTVEKGLPNNTEIILQEFGKTWLAKKGVTKPVNHVASLILEREVYGDILVIREVGKDAGFSFINKCLDEQLLDKDT